MRGGDDELQPVVELLPLRRGMFAFVEHRTGDVDDPFAKQALPILKGNAIRVRVRKSVAGSRTRSPGDERGRDRDRRADRFRSEGETADEGRDLFATPVVPERILRARRAPVARAKPR